MDERGAFVTTLAKLVFLGGWRLSKGERRERAARVELAMREFVMWFRVGMCVLLAISLTWVSVSMSLRWYIVLCFCED